MFWSSGILTGSQTPTLINLHIPGFWSSGILTGSQTCEAEGIDLEQAIIIKNEFNKTRPYKHGGKVI